MYGKEFFHADKGQPAQAADEPAAPQNPLRSLEQDPESHRSKERKDKSLQIVHHHGRPPQVQAFSANTSPMAIERAKRAASAIRLLPLNRSPAI